jgi:MFS transporter, DHA1 family, tetracycline resistance protein
MRQGYAGLSPMQLVNSVVSSSTRASLRLVQVTVFVDLLGISLIIPVLPLLIGLFTTSKAAQAYWFMALGMTFGLMQFTCAPLLGALSDRFGRRPVLLIGIGGLCVSFLGGALAPTLGWLLATRVVSGATAANLSVAQAYAADITPPEGRARAFGQLGAAFGVAFVVGPVVGGLLGAVNLRLPFVLAALLGLANFCYALLVLPESLPAERRRPVNLARCNPFAAIALLFKLRGVGALLIAIALTTLAQFTLQFTWVLYTNFRFGWNTLANGLSLFVAGVGAVLVQGLLLSRLLDYFGERRLVVLATGSALVASVLFAVVPAGWMLYLVIAGNMLANAGSPTLQSIVSKAADPKTQGQMMGALAGVGSAAMIVAPLCGPSLLAQVSELPPSDWRVGAPFFLSATLQFFALVVTVIHFARHPAPAK